MEKRLLLAIGLSLLVLLSWSAFSSKTQPVDSQQVTVTKTNLVEPRPNQETSASQAVLAEDLTQPPVHFIQNNTEIFFDEQHAAIN